MLVRLLPSGDTPAPPTGTVPASFLVVSDDPEVRDFLMELAIEEGYGVRCARTELEVRAALDEERPGLVIGDLDMPSRAGDRVLRALRRSEVDRDIARFGLTSSNDTMISVAIDAPVFFKPGLDGLGQALAHLFKGDRRSPRR
jgi:CheY-like chemotaxis protein